MIRDILIRHRYATDPEFPYDIAAWCVRPQECSGPHPTIRIADDSVEALQEAMDRCNARFGDPTKVIQNPPLKVPEKKPRRAR